MRQARKPCCRSRVKVLYVNIEKEIAGAEKSLLLILKHLTSEYDAVAACPRKGGLINSLKTMNLQVFPMSCTPQNKYGRMFTWLWYYFVVNIQLLLIVNKSKPNIVHANNTKSVLALLMSVLFTKAKIVWHVRDAGRYPKIFKLCRCISTQVLAVSYSIKTMLVKEGVPEKAIEVVYNTTEIGTLPHRVGEGMTYANIGQYVPWKNQELFIDAAEEYLRRGYTARFMLIGSDIFGRDGSYGKKLYRKIKESSFSQCFQLEQWQDNLGEVWGKIDCLIHTAINEPFGRVIIEAMEKQVPVIVPNEYGPSEIVKDNITGLLFRPSDREDLIRCMKEMQFNPDKRKKLAMAGYNYVCSQHNTNYMMDKILSIYRQLVA